MASIAFILPKKQKDHIVVLAGEVKDGAIDLAVAVGLLTCRTKGNISYNTGQKIYHVLGQEYYQSTRINVLAGERYFCNERDARTAGWRRA